MTGIFPDKWKISYILPILIGKNISSVTNYYLISLTSIIPKIFKSIVYSKISLLFKQIIGNEQHEFMTDKSTTTNLLVFQQYVLEAFRSQVDVIYTDF